MKKEFRELAKFPEEIRWLGDSILRKKTALVTRKEIRSGEVATIIKKLGSTLKKIQVLGRGVAIAAPQIGISKAVTLVSWDTSYLTFINPVITRHSETKSLFPEGCLSSLPLTAEVIRSSEVDISYLDEQGTRRKKHFDGKLARIIQHEIDHLNGVLFIDRADLKTARFVSDFESYKKSAKLTDL